MKIPTQRQVAYVRNSFPIGTRVELVEMDDVQAPPVGTEGTVIFVDDMADVAVAWDNGSTLSAVYGVDYIKKV